MYAIDDVGGEANLGTANGTNAGESNSTSLNKPALRPKTSSIQSSQRFLLDKVALGIISYLESLEECNEITFQCNKEISSFEIGLWEKRNLPLKLPVDIKKFYSSVFNGFTINWTIEVNEQIIPVGEIRVNAIEEMKVQIAPEICSFPSHLPNDVAPPNLATCTLISLDNRCPSGNVVLLYRNSISSTSDSVPSEASIIASSSGAIITNIDSLDSPEVWLLTNTCQLIYLCQSFIHYLRLMITHLGIFHWQLAFSDDGVPQQADQYMQLFCKERLIIDKHYRLHA